MTTSRVFLRRDTRTNNNAYIGGIGELTYNTTDSTIRIFDGQTAGGFEALVNGRSIPTTFNANVTTTGSIIANGFQFSNGALVGSKFRNLFVLLKSGAVSMVPSESTLEVKPHVGANVSLSVPSTQNYLNFTKRNNVTTYIPIY